MARFDHTNQVIHCKIAYYGPGMAGKTTTLQYIHWQTPAENRSELLSVATETERTLFFDLSHPQGAQLADHICN
jgi:GTPase SAR1 family protein